MKNITIKLPFVIYLANFLNFRRCEQSFAETEELKIMLGKMGKALLLLMMAATALSGLEFAGALRIILPFSPYALPSFVVLAIISIVALSYVTLAGGLLDSTSDFEVSLQLLELA